MGIIYIHIMTSETKNWRKKEKCTGLEIGPQCMGGPMRGMYTLPHPYIFRNCINFCHGTTLKSPKRVSKVTRKVTSNSGFVLSSDFLPYVSLMSKCLYKICIYSAESVERDIPNGIQFCTKYSKRSWGRWGQIWIIIKTLFVV